MKKNKFKLKEMKYITKTLEKPLILAKGTSNGHEFMIISWGTHPCSYIKIPKTSKLIRLGYEDIPLSCHGGLTFAGEHKQFKGYWLGWDYSHCDDFAGRYLDDSYPKILYQDNKKWTTDEMIKEMWDATYAFEQLRKFINLITATEEFEKDD